MFTGIITRIGTITAIDPSEGGGTVELQLEPWERSWETGESIAVQGVCLTLVGFESDRIRFDILQETFDRTNLGTKKVGDRLNLERALRYGDPLGGHLVSGHVDGRGTMEAIHEVGRDWRIDVGCPAELLDGILFKGSICIDGVSLTVAELRDDGFSVHLIPHTWEVTSLGGLSAGDTVNLEIDLAGKFIRRMVERGQWGGELTWEALREQGL